MPLRKHHYSDFPHWFIPLSPRLGIAVIPESLIAVLTITMAAGTSRMAKSHVVVRQLNALEGIYLPYSSRSCC